MKYHIDLSADVNIPSDENAREVLQAWIEDLLVAPREVEIKVGKEDFRPVSLDFDRVYLTSCREED